MNRLSILVFWVGVIVVASFLLYRVKYEVQSLKAQIADTNLEIAQERESLHVVAAEWAYLNRPERLKTLADKYLGGKDVTVDQVAEIEAIAFRKQAVASVEIEDNNIRPISTSYRASNVQP